MSGFVSRLTFSPHHINSATTISARGNQVDVFAKVVFRRVFQQFTGNGAGNGRDATKTKAVDALLAARPR